MCGRYVLRAPKAELKQAFGLREEPQWEPRFNLAPTQQALIITQAERDVAVRARWGFLPHWAATTHGVAHFNARAETIATKPLFREAFVSHRCLVPADGYYEWRRDGAARTPFLFTAPEGGLMSFAGLYSVWRHEGEAITSFTIVTQASAGIAATIHDRMPIVLSPAQRQLWLDGLALDALQLETPAFQKLQVGPYVGSTAIDDERCIAPATIVQMDLF